MKLSTMSSLSPPIQCDHSPHILVPSDTCRRQVATTENNNESTMCLLDALLTEDQSDDISENVNNDMIDSEGLQRFSIPTIVVVDDSDLNRNDSILTHLSTSTLKPISNNKINGVATTKHVNDLQQVDSAKQDIISAPIRLASSSAAVQQPASQLNGIGIGNSSPEKPQSRNSNFKRSARRSQSTAHAPKQLPLYKRLANQREPHTFVSSMHFPRRSYSHPEQLNLIVDEDRGVGEAKVGIANGGLQHVGLDNGGRKHVNPPSGSKDCEYTNSPLRNVSHTAENPEIREREESECHGRCRDLESPIFGLEELEDDDNVAFLMPGEETDRDEENLWTSRPTEFKLRDQLYSFFQASDNKLAMKLFGSRTALLKEKRRQMAERNWIIHPCSNFRLYWDLLMLIFLITNLIVLPVSIAFFYDDVGVHWMVFNITCDTMFILDIIINFRTGLIDSESHGSVILDPKAIALKYLKSWFVVDFVSSLPLDYVFLSLEGQSYSAGRALRILRLAKLLQLLRLLRISRLVRYVRLWQEFFSIASIVVKLFNLICIMVLMGHWSGCIQFFVPVIQGLPADSWIVLNELQNSDWWEQYSRSLFKALSHMLCIGYGQFPPRNMTDTWLTIASMLAGATCYALFIGHATTLIQSFDTSSRQFRDHLQQVNEYMIYRKLPTELRRRITDYYDHRFGGKMFDEAAILSEISDSLRQDIISHNCRELIKNVPFFVNADSSFVTDVITKLEFEMYQPGDVIIKADTKGDRMYFIQEGLIEIMNERGKIVTRLGDGSYFGEICLLTQQKRTATVRAATYSNLFSLSKDHFDRILENYPLMRRTLETIAAKRLHTLGKDPNLVASRESLLEDVSGIQRVFQTVEKECSDEESEQCSSPTPSRTSNSQFLTVVRSFFTKDSEEFSPSSRAPSMRTGLMLQSDLPRCKSTANTSSVVKNLILIPQAAASLGRRAKSTADVQHFSFEQPNCYKQENEEFHSTTKRERRASMSPVFKRKSIPKAATSALPSSNSTLQKCQSQNVGVTCDQSVSIRRLGHQTLPNSPAINRSSFHKAQPDSPITNSSFSKTPQACGTNTSIPIRSANTSSAAEAAAKASRPMELTNVSGLAKANSNHACHYSATPPRVRIRRQTSESNHIGSDGESSVRFSLFDDSP